MRSKNKNQLKKEEALEKLEEANIEPEKQEEAEAVKEDLKRRS